MIEIKKFSECEFAPNILYEIVRNETKYYKHLHAGGYIRNANCDLMSIVGAYWGNTIHDDYDVDCMINRLVNKENDFCYNKQFRNIYKNLLEMDWRDKIFVKYDKEYVYKTLYNNAKQEYEYYLDITEMCKKKMEKYQGVLNESNSMD